MKIILKVIMIILSVISIVSAQVNGDIASGPDILCNEPAYNKATIHPNGVNIIYDYITVIDVTETPPFIPSGDRPIYTWSIDENTNIISFFPSDVTYEHIFLVTIPYEGTSISARCNIPAQSSIPEFPTIAIPIISIIGLMLLLKKR